MTNFDSNELPVTDASIVQPIQNIQSPPVPLNVEAPVSIIPNTPSNQVEINNTSTQSSDNQIDSDKESWLKYLGYYFLGFILSIVGLIIGIILITKKESQAKVLKIIVLLLGFLLSIVVFYTMFGGKIFKRTTLSNFLMTKADVPWQPKEILLDLNDLYPNLPFQVTYLETDPLSTLENTVISNIVKVEISSENDLTPIMISKIGKQVCKTFARFQKTVGQVELTTINNTSTAESPNIISGTCEEYNSNAILNTLQIKQQ